ncbi:hypothetical protein RUM44_006277 [Polyplax serrata]|uniref:non-specific serine/threonine protein kinase n=1 Tax=Polyplax serrata TaxID=468196 RepID=A0ABR1AHM8_POLSC
MEKCAEPVSLRNGRLFNSVLTRSGPMQRTTRMRMSQDALLDAFILLYDECNKEITRKDTNVSKFINKYRTLLTEIKSLRVNINDFDIKDIIGQGHFGEVRVVKEKQTNDIYAMKIIKKFEMSGKLCSVLFEEEHDIMCTATSHWLTTLQYSFQDSDNLYFIMDYHSGGDLLSLLDRHEGVLTPEMARFYLAETALAIRALHQMGYVHRDIKPDNILLDRCGHIKLADFGSAAKLSSSGMVTQAMPVGTPEYIAPEILLSLDHGGEDKIKKQYYGIECDYWSLGILAYELVVGRTPFSGDQIKATYFNIMNHKSKLKYPDDKVVPESLKDLISKLLDDPSIRLKHDGVVKHSFFRETSWSDIRNEVPPFVPSCTSPDDISNFIEISRKKPTPRIEIKNCKKEFSGKQLPFIGFTFSHIPDVSDKKLNDAPECNGDKRNTALEALLSVSRKENQNLVSKLFEAQFGKSEEIDSLEKKLEEKKRLLEICENDRNKLQRDLAKLQAENNNIQRVLELERQDRRDMEANALRLISDNKSKIERNFNNQIQQLNSIIEEINDKLTESHTVNNEITSKLDRTKTELAAADKEIERLKNVEIEFKSKMAEAREYKRKSVVGLESRLEKLANDNQVQVNVLQQKLNDETSNKQKAEEKLKEMEAIWEAQKSQLKQDIKEREEKIAKLDAKTSAQNAEIASFHAQLSEKSNVKFLEEKLEVEKAECMKLRTRIVAMEQELANSTNSFMDHESTIAAHEETMQALEKELKEASEEKIRLQKKLQKTKEIDEENRQKLSNLEIVVDRLEQGVIKLEVENTKLKQQVIAHAQPITSEAEARYQEKITILEDQIVKFENQLQKLRESTVLDKESQRVTQSSLWKTEKELSDCKIDLRIAKRELKTAEDLANRVQEEVKKINDKLVETDEKHQKSLALEREKLDKVNLEKAHIKSELGQRELEIKMLKKQLEEFKELEDGERQLKKEYNEVVQKCKILEKQAETLREEKEKMKELSQSAEAAKVKTESLIEELRQKIASLELNNTVLKETGAMLDEQLEDYDKFTTTQAQKIERLTQEKASLQKEMEKVQNELHSTRQILNEEKSLKLRAEQRVVVVEDNVAEKESFIAKLEQDLCSCNILINNMKTELSEYEEKVTLYENEIKEGRQMYDALEGECQWLKKEASSYLTNMYTLRESNYKITQDLEEEHHMVEALQERICDLQNIISELEAFYKQREVKDEATKQQQNKLIAFLQEKLGDTKKKKSLSDVLFRTRNKENVFPATSPASSRNVSNRLLGNKASGKNLQNSPTAKEAVSQLVKSPTSQYYFRRKISKRRMRHNIPHRFTNQTQIRDGTCGVCQSQISRSSQCSSCTQCKILAHPKCAIIAPKTCGLPQGLVKHYAKSVVKSNSNDDSPVKGGEGEHQGPTAVEGWVKLLNSSKTAWDRKYARLEHGKIIVFEQNSERVIDLCQEGSHLIVGESVESDELPNTAKTNIPFTIKIATIPETTCWPEQVHYLMTLTSADKTKWLMALNSIALASPATEKEKYHGSIIRSFPKDLAPNFNCMVQINEKLAILGAEDGIYSLKLHISTAEPVKIGGVSRVHQINLSPQLGIAVMIAEEDRRLLMCDHRALVSNAEAASCANPRIVVRPIEAGLESENCLLFSISPTIEGNVYMTVATSNKLFILKWCLKNSEFLQAKVLDTLHPCNCVLYTTHSVVVGCDKFFEIELSDFSAQEFLDSSLKSLAFWRIGSFPMQIFQVSRDEFLLCFNEFGVFVNESGNKTQCDLKWNKVPCDFAYCKPFLFVIHMSSVEVIRVPFLDSKSANDSICTSSTATVSDSVHISFNTPRYLGNSKNPGSIVMKAYSGVDVNLLSLDARKLYEDDLGSCASLNTISDLTRDPKNNGDEFSFTSSLVNSLEDVGTSTPRHSDEESCTTYTVSENENASNKKVVTFVQRNCM